MLKGSDFDIDFSPAVAYILYWDNNYNVISQCTMHQETLYPIPLIQAIQTFKPEFAKGANVNFSTVTGELTDVIVFKF